MLFSKLSESHVGTHSSSASVHGTHLHTTLSISVFTYHVLSLDDHDFAKIVFTVITVIDNEPKTQPQVVTPTCVALCCYRCKGAPCF